MDNQEFLSLFNSLADDNGSTSIVSSSEKLTNLILSKQKFEQTKEKHEINFSKYKLYDKIISNPTEDLLYSLRRLIGGIVSTGLDMRRGFVLSFTLLIEKLSPYLNFLNLIDTIEKESVVSKSEKNHVKNCTLTGKILIYRSLLNLKNLDVESILKIIKIILDLLSNAAYKILEESILMLLKNVFDNIFNGYYLDFNEETTSGSSGTTGGKKGVKAFEKIINTIERMFLVHKVNLASIKGLTEISMFLIINSYLDGPGSKTKKGMENSNTTQYKRLIESVTSKNILQSLTEKSAFINLMSLIIKTKKDTDFHIAFNLLLQNLKNSKNFNIVISYWNSIIDNDNQELFKTISLKNYQFLIFKYSKFILENFFESNMASIFELFDNTFFQTLFTFTSDKKFKYINSIIESLMNNFNTNSDDGQNNEKDQKIKSDYCFSLLSIFGSNPSFSLSPNTNKSFFIFLFKNLNADKNETYVRQLLESQDDFYNEDADDEVDEDVEKDEVAGLDAIEQDKEDKKTKKNFDKLQFNFMALKQILLAKDANIQDEILDHITNSFFTHYLENTNQVYQDLLEDRVVFVVLSKIKKLLDDKSTKNFKIVKYLIKTNNFLINLLKEKKNFNLDIEDVKEYKLFYKQFYKIYESLGELIKNQNNSEKVEKISSVLRISLLLLITFLKNMDELSETLNDLIEIANNFINDTKETDGDNWEKIFTDIVLSQLSRGKNLVTDFVMNSFKKISKHLNKEALDVIVEFINEDLNTK